MKHFSPVYINKIVRRFSYKSVASKRRKYMCSEFLVIVFVTGNIEGDGDNREDTPI